MIIVTISVLAFASSLLAIFFRIKKNQKYFAIFKPLTTIFIIAIAAFANYQNPTDYSTIIIYGLILSLIGDVFLVFEKYFLQGLIAFSFAHIAFLFAFISFFGFSVNVYILIALVLISVSYYSFLYKSLASFKIPVIVYILIIAMMDLQALGLMINDFKPEFIAIAIGSLFFSFSDMVIAYDKFKKPFRFSESLILSTYWIAIYIFALVALYI